MVKISGLTDQFLPNLTVKIQIMVMVFSMFQYKIEEGVVVVVVILVFQNMNNCIQEDQ